MAWGQPPSGYSDAVPATGDRKWAERFASDVTGTLTQIQCLQSGGTSAQKHKAFAYADAAGPAPGALLTNGVSNEVTVAAGAPKGLVTYTFATPPSGTQGVFYWIGVLSESVAGPGSFYALPLTAVGSLTLVNVITDADRLQNLVGDGYPYPDSSVTIEQQSRNLIVNGSFELDLSNWTFV